MSGRRSKYGQHRGLVSLTGTLVETFKAFVLGGQSLLVGCQSSAAGVAEYFVVVGEAGVATGVHHMNAHSGYPDCVDARADGLFTQAPVWDWYGVFNLELWFFL